MLSTRATEKLGIRHPIVQAGMARGFTGAELVAAVSGAGGLGVLGCLNRPADETVSDIQRIRTLTDRPFGLNFVVHHLDEDAFEAALAERVPVITFFRGEPERVVARAHAAGAAVIYQVTTVEEAQRAIRAGADMLIAQGSEAGGHVGPIALSTILPAVVAIAGGRPVFAAGGIVDGSSLAAAMRLGADGGWIGTRFLATPESPALPAHKQAIVDAGPGATVRTTMWDLIWGRPWPGVEVRAIRNALVDRWIDRQGEIPVVRAEITAGMEQAELRGDAAETDLLAGEGVGRIRDIRPAGELVGEISADAEEILRSQDQA
jgi:NAD(P)H-dependent flavin oxidoreductase YrpB (nitropropane dioxygenase family)